MVDGSGPERTGHGQYCPLSRAADTARLIGFGDRAQTRDDLREWDYGEYEGWTTAQIRESDPGWTIWSVSLAGCRRTRSSSSPTSRSASTP